MPLIFDFYVDEPTCLGVPPYLSPYCRYVAGALVQGGFPEESVSYLTVDQWRDQGKELKSDPELVVIIAGQTVPGKYLGGKMGTLAEIFEFLDFRRKYQKQGAVLVGGPIQRASDEIQREIVRKKGTLVKGDIEAAAQKIAAWPGGVKAALQNLCDNEGIINAPLEARSEGRVDDWARRGAFITNPHPNFPYLTLEIETYRGCARRRHCSFCSEVFYGRPDFRSINGIIEEVKELSAMGNKYFRLGRQADLFGYQADLNDYVKGFPRPRPKQVAALYSGVRRAAPDLKVLHLDNVNPGAVSVFEKESAEIAAIISSFNTPGDTAAMGIESVDPLVIKLNDLKCDREQALRATEIINQAGAAGKNGIPALLPGLNFISGLPGESPDTFRQNYEFLKDVLDKGLLLRRINIRQVRTHKNTRLEEIKSAPRNMKKVSGKYYPPGLLKNKFLYYRDKIRKEIDLPMLRKVFPRGVVLREVIPESQNQGYVFGRQLGSYPMTVKIPLSDPRASAALRQKRPLDVIITGHKERSLLGLTHPIRVNRLGDKALSQIPGVGRRAGKIMTRLPAQNFEQWQTILESPPFASAKDYVFEG